MQSQGLQALPVHFTSSSSLSTTQGDASKYGLQRGSLSPPQPREDLPPPATSQLSLGPHTPSVFLNYQQEPAEHTVGFLHHRNNDRLLHSSFPSSPSSPASPNTRGYVLCAYLLSLKIGTCQKATQALSWRCRQGVE